MQAFLWVCPPVADEHVLGTILCVCVCVCVCVWWWEGPRLLSVVLLMSSAVQDNDLTGDLQQAI